MATPLINGREYDWAMVQAQIGNSTNPFYGVTSISYSDTMEKENVYGAGSMPVSRGYGNYTVEASIELLTSDIVRLMRSVGSRRLQDLPPFDLIIRYAHNQADKRTTDIIKNAEFTNNGRELSQNDKSFSTELTIVASHIQWDGAQTIGLNPGLV